MGPSTVGKERLRGLMELLSFSDTRLLWCLSWLNYFYCPETSGAVMIRRIEVVDSVL